MTFRIILCMLIILFSQMNISYGQNIVQEIDPSGYIQKYDIHFEGIGPKVYVLPAPRTKKQELTDTYREISSFYDSINTAIRDQKVISNFRKFPQDSIISTLLLPVPVQDQDWDLFIQRFHNQGNHAVAFGIYNEQAKRALSSGNIDTAIKTLEKALATPSYGQNEKSLPIIQANLATLQLIKKNTAAAKQYEEAFYASAVKDRNTKDQAISLTKLALIQALDKDFDAAESTIIRKAIPLYNRSKYYQGKIWAWEMLADMYQTQEKHTEAQWFLIQARDLAKARKLDAQLAEIEYMLGYSKFIQKNYDVAKQELISAYDLAEKEDNNLLKLAIVGKLGEIYLLQNNIELADKLLKEYWTLRARLF